MITMSSVEDEPMPHPDPLPVPKTRPWLVFGLFVVLTLVLTYPLILNLGHGVRDMGDPLLNSWIMAWNVRKIVHLDWKGFFDANIFYPTRKTLAYSEFLIPQSILALPVLLVSKNPILAYNIVLLLAFVTSAFGMFLLAFHLTKNVAAGVIAGIIFAFSPFMFAHLTHLQVLSAGGIPLTFLFLHRFFNSRSSRDFYLFALFYILQVLANGYYALYLTLFAGLFIIFQIFRRKLLFDPRFWLKIGAFVLLVAVTAGPFYYQYIRVRSEMGFSREIGFSARPANFLATSKINRLYGRVTERAWSPEGELFPGAVAFLLGLAGLVSGISIKKTRATFRQEWPGSRLRRVKVLLNILILLWFGLVIGVIIFGGFRLAIGQVLVLRAHRLLNPLLTLGGLIILRLFIDRLARIKLPRFAVRGNERVLIYGAILILAVLFSFGPKGPYILLYKYFPGFDGLRVTSRFHIFTLFSLAVLAAWGIKEIAGRLKARAFPATTGLLSFLILAEYFSVPVPFTRMPVRDEIPEVYRWLASQKEENFAILELPVPQPTHSFCVLDCPRIYYSIYHWKSLVNGFSGYSSPLYEELARRWHRHTLSQNLEDIKVLGIRYLLVHSTQFREGDLRRLLERLPEFEPELRHVKGFATAEVFEFAGYKSLPGRDALLRSAQPSWLTGARVRANVNEEQAAAAVDGSLKTRWESGPQEIGHLFEVDLGATQRIRGISMLLGTYGADYPRGYAVDVSIDGVAWHEVARQEDSRLPLTAYLKPRSLPFEIHFPDVEARWVRITNLGEDRVFSWSICELGVFMSESPGDNRTQFGNGEVFP